MLEHAVNGPMKPIEPAAEARRNPRVVNDGYQRHITLLIESSTSWGNNIVQGIADYAHKYANWIIYFEPRGKYELLELPAGWHGDGVIARVTHPRLARQLVEENVPAVNVSWYDYEGGAIPRCTTNERISAEMVAQHFLDRGFKRFAYCGPRRRPQYCDLFGAAYAERIEQAGHSCHVYSSQLGLEDGAPSKEEQYSLMEWVERLPKPVALLAFSDVRGRQVVEACRQASISVPDEVAIMGGEYDQLASQISRPRLSSIDLSPHRVGFNAAHLLDNIMSGEQPPSEPLLLPPARILVEVSTDTLAVDDPLVRRALVYIAAEMHRPITVKHVLANVPTSRRVLEKRFKESLGRSPGEEIRRVRIEHAKKLLAETNVTLRQVASECGFFHAEVLSRVFRRTTGETPSNYRKRVQSSH